MFFKKNANLQETKVPKKIYKNEIFVSGDQVTLHIDRFQELLESEKENATLKSQIESLTKRDNKLQQIEQMFQNGTVDLAELSKLVKDK